MSTQLEQAKNGVLTSQMKEVALSEGVAESEILKRIKEGKVIIPFNRRRRRSMKVLGIGQGLSTKINANIGTSIDHLNLEEELKKVDLAIKYGADTLMDLSTGGDIDMIRKAIIERSTVPIGTVPIYQTMCEMIRRENGWKDIKTDDFFQAVIRQAEDGVDFVTVHCGINKESVERIAKQGRILGIVSRGGALLSKWMEYNQKENPFFSEYDRLLEIAKDYDLTLSLGDGLRPGCLADATDRGQVQETIILGELAARAKDKGVQVMIEGPGHVPLNQIKTNIEIQKALCNSAPFYVLGPLVTDLAPGYDHITSAIGGAIAGAAGADYLCYVTPAEHLRLPTLEDVKEGVVAAKIAAHAADIAKGIPGAMERNNRMARMRKDLNWQEQINLSFDPEKAAKYRKECPPNENDVCSMCGTFCAIKVGKK